MDITPGDRASDCYGMMEPSKVETKGGSTTSPTNASNAVTKNETKCRRKIFLRKFENIKMYTVSSDRIFSCTFLIFQ